MVVRVKAGVTVGPRVLPLARGAAMVGLRLRGRH
jgi:hypothetical protein